MYALYEKDLLNLLFYLINSFINLFIYFLLSNLFLSNNLITLYKIIENYSCINILFLVSTISFILFYLDNFQLSKNILLKYTQIIYFFLILLFCFLFIYDYVASTNIILSVADMNNNIGTHVNINGHVNVNDKEAGQSWALTGAMVGVGGAVEKAIAKSPIPPLQKATVIVGASVIGGISQVATNYFNKGLAGVGKSNTNIDNNISKFIDDSEFNPLQGVL